MNLIRVVFLSLLIIINFSCTREITLKVLVSEMSDRGQLTYFQNHNYKLLQASSYNRESLSPDEPGWFANGDMSHFIRVDRNKGRREFVLLDSEGPGVIVRWWMTFYRAKDGIIRIYLDNNATPEIQGTPSELLSGNLITEYPFVSSVQQKRLGEEYGRDVDHNFYLPIPFSRHCKITYESDSLFHMRRGQYYPDVFYNIDFRKYSPSVKIKTFKINQLNETNEIIHKAKNRLLGADIPDVPHIKRTKKLVPGDTCWISLFNKASAINFLSLRLKSPNLSQSLRSTLLTCSFDNDSTVWSPVGDFFGTGYQINVHKTWMNDVDTSGNFKSFWIMPFKERSDIIFHNFSKDTVNVEVEVGLTKYEWRKNSMYFGASWKGFYHIQTRNVNGEPYDLNFLRIYGQGLYVGDAMTIFNSSWMWWGEGDEKIFIDGEGFPSIFGTGTEDYYGYSFGRPASFSHPFISQPVGRGNEGNPWGITMNMRYRSLDAIPFNSSIDVNMELWHWDKKAKVDYDVTTFWYIKPGSKLNIKRNLNEIQKKVSLTLDEFLNPK